MKKRFILRLDHSYFPMSYPDWESKSPDERENIVHQTIEEITAFVKGEDQTKTILFSLYKSFPLIEGKLDIHEVDQNNEYKVEVSNRAGARATGKVYGKHMNDVLERLPTK